MAIRYISFADQQVLTAENMLNVQYNGVVQVTTYAELATVNAAVNCAYVTADTSFYVRKSANSWGSVGGLATIQASAPTNPQTGQIWFDTDLVLPSGQKVTYAGSETVTATSPTALVNLATATVTLTEPAWVHVSYGVVEPSNTLAADSVSMAVQLSGATTRAASATDYATSYGTSKNSVANDFNYIFNTGATVVTAVAKRTNTASGSSAVKDMYINVMPIRWS